MTDADTKVVATEEAIAATPLPSGAGRTRVVPYPALECHGVIGDRRTAALVSADGTLGWACLPDFDSAPIFGALLDWAKGGHWRIGPARMALGRQSYLEKSAILQTQWELDEGSLSLQDAMLWPETDRAPEQREVRAVVRNLRCVRGNCRCEMDLRPGEWFRQISPGITQRDSHFTLQLPSLSLRFWSSHPPAIESGRLRHEFELKEGEEVWAVLELGAAGHGWSIEAAREALERTRRYWEDWVGGLHEICAKDLHLQRTAITVHLLTYAPSGAVVAAPTTSVPERIGGGWNADYRLCWVRDASLSVAGLAHLGNLRETEQYLQWLIHRLTRFGRPLQVLYEIRGEKRPAQTKLPEVSGYRDSRPVWVGNHAYKQRQLGSYGYLADCVWIYLQEGGEWRPEYWKLIQRLANYTIKHWPDTENGIWELPEQRHYVCSKVLSWVMLDRAIRIAQKVNAPFDPGPWESVRETIHREVMDRGWSEKMGAFRQHYDADNLDASALLISLMDFLPADHPRVLATIDRIARDLTIDDFVYRFDPLETPGQDPRPLGQLEGAFLPSTFWLAAACAKAGWPERAEKILRRAEQVSGGTGLFSEAVDPRAQSFLGNTPLLFSHVEYVRARMEVARAKDKSRAS